MQLEKVRVTLDHDEVYDVELTNRSAIQFEKEAALRKWPESDTLSRTFQAWWELVKMAKTLDCTFDDFSSTLCLEVAPYIAEERLVEMVRTGMMQQFVADELRADGLVLEAAIAVDPTQPATPSEERLT